MAVVVVGGAVQRLTFGHATAAAARRALNLPAKTNAGGACPLPDLARRLQAFAAGKDEPLDDIPVDLGSMTDFRHRVLGQCRRIPRGSTMSYAKLGEKAGFHDAARAVGNCMAANPIPLLIPCHRVVRADGRLGSYSAPGGGPMKRRLLALESTELT